MKDGEYLVSYKMIGAWIEVNGNTITDSAPIFRWMIGKNPETLPKHYKFEKLGLQEDNGSN